ncbi:hypothetical protein EGW08_016484, partial [Elysia chlorotica]
QNNTYGKNCSSVCRPDCHGGTSQVCNHLTGECLLAPPKEYHLAYMITGLVIVLVLVGLYVVADMLSEEDESKRKKNDDRSYRLNEPEEEELENSEMDEDLKSLEGEGPNSAMVSETHVAMSKSTLGESTPRRPMLSVALAIATKSQLSLAAAFNAARKSMEESEAKKSANNATLNQEREASDESETESSSESV